MISCTALVVAAGRGARLGAPLPKQYLPLGGMAVNKLDLERVRITTEEGQEAVVVLMHPRREGKFPAVLVQPSGTRRESHRMIR